MAPIPSLSLSCFPGKQDRDFFFVYGQGKQFGKKKISLPSKVGREMLAWIVKNGQKGVLPKLPAPSNSVTSFM